MASHACPTAAVLVVEATHGTAAARFLVISSPEDTRVRLIKVRAQGYGLKYNGIEGEDVFSTLGDALDVLRYYKGPGTKIHLLAMFRWLIGCTMNTFGTWLCGVTEAECTATVHHHSIWKVVHSRWLNINILKRLSPDSIFESLLIAPVFMTLPKECRTIIVEAFGLTEYYSAATDSPTESNSLLNNNENNNEQKNKKGIFNRNDQHHHHQQQQQQKTTGNGRLHRIRSGLLSNNTNSYDDGKIENNEYYCYNIDDSYFINKIDSILKDLNKNDINGNTNTNTNNGINDIASLTKFNAEEFYYFSDTLDLTHSFPCNINNNSQSPNRDYEVNYMLASAFLEIGLRKCCIILVHGIVTQLSEFLSVSDENQNISKGNRKLSLVILSKRIYKPVMTKNECLGIVCVENRNNKSEKRGRGMRFKEKELVKNNEPNNITNFDMNSFMSFLPPAHVELVPNDMKQEIYNNPINYTSTDIILSNISEENNELSTIYTSTIDSMIPPTSLLSELMIIHRNESSTKMQIASPSSSTLGFFSFSKTYKVVNNENITSANIQNSKILTPDLKSENNVFSANKRYLNQEFTTIKSFKDSLIAKIIDGIVTSLLTADIQKSAYDKQTALKELQDGCDVIKNNGNSHIKDFSEEKCNDLLSLVSLKLSSMIDPTLIKLHGSANNILEIDPLDKKNPDIHIFCENYDIQDQSNILKEIESPNMIKGKSPKLLDITSNKYKDTLFDISMNEFMNEFSENFLNFININISDLSELYNAQSETGFIDLEKLELDSNNNNINNNITINQEIKTLQNNMINVFNFVNSTENGETIKQIQKQTKIPLLFGFSDKIKVALINIIFSILKQMIDKNNIDTKKSNHSENLLHGCENFVFSWIIKLYAMEMIYGIPSCLLSIDPQYMNFNTPNLIERLKLKVDREIELTLENENHNDIEEPIRNESYLEYLKYILEPSKLQIFSLNRDTLFNLQGILMNSEIMKTNILKLGNQKCFVGIQKVKLNPLFENKSEEGSSNRAFTLMKYMPGIMNNYVKLPHLKDSEYFKKITFITPSMVPIQIILDLPLGKLIKSFFVIGGPTISLQMPLCQETLLPNICSITLNNNADNNNNTKHRIKCIYNLDINYDFYKPNEFKYHRTNAGFVNVITVFFYYDIASIYKRNNNETQDEPNNYEEEPKISFIGLIPHSKLPYFLAQKQRTISNFTNKKHNKRNSSFYNEDVCNYKLLNDYYGSNYNTSSSSSYIQFPQNKFTKLYNTEQFYEDNENYSDINLSDDELENTESAIETFISDINSLEDKQDNKFYEIPEVFIVSELLIRMWNRKNKFFPLRSKLYLYHEMNKRLKIEYPYLSEFGQGLNINDGQSTTRINSSSSNRISRKSKDILTSQQSQQQQQTESSTSDLTSASNKYGNEYNNSIPDYLMKSILSNPKAMKMLKPKKINLGNQKFLDEIKSYLVVPISSGNKLMLNHYNDQENIKENNDVYPGSITLGTALYFEKYRLQSDIPTSLANILLKWQIPSLGGYTRLTPEMMIFPVKQSLKKTTRCRRCDCLVQSNTVNNPQELLSNGVYGNAIYELNMYPLDNICQQCCQIEEFLRGLMITRDTYSNLNEVNKEKNIVENHIYGIQLNINSVNNETYQKILKGFFDPNSYSDIYANSINCINILHNDTISEEEKEEEKEMLSLLCVKYSCIIFHPLMEKEEHEAFDKLLTGDSLKLRSNNVIHIPIAFFEDFILKSISVIVYGHCSIKVELINSTTLDFTPICTINIENKEYEYTKLFDSGSLDKPTRIIVLTIDTNNTNEREKYVLLESIKIFGTSTKTLAINNDKILNEPLVSQEIQNIEIVNHSENVNEIQNDSKPMNVVINDEKIHKGRSILSKKTRNQNETLLKKQENILNYDIPILIQNEVFTRVKWPGDIESFEYGFKNKTKIKGVYFDYTDVLNKISQTIFKLDLNVDFINNIVYSFLPKEVKITVYNPPKFKKVKEKTIAEENLQTILPSTYVKIFRITLPMFSPIYKNSLPKSIKYALDKNGIYGSRITVEFFNTYSRILLGVISSLLPIPLFF